MSTSSQALILLAHGSRNPEAREEYARIWSAVSERLSVPVHFGVLEFPGDDLLSIADAVATCAREGAARVVALPLFLFSAGHVREDIPEEIEAALRETPVQLLYQPPLGVHPSLLDVVADRAAEALSADGSAEPAALVLVGAGTSDPQSNSELYRAARLLWERKQHPYVDVAFVSLTEPTVSEVLGRCKALGWQRVVLAPYFLNTGVLARRIRARVTEAQESLPDLKIVVAEHFGIHPSLIDLLVERAEQALVRSVTASNLELPPCALTGLPWACRL
jgi:sirohydrochlorin cobaltochelatase